MKIWLSAFSDEAGASFEEQLKALNRNNIPYTELRSVDGKEAMELSISQAKEYRKKFEDGGVKVWSVGSFIGKDNIDEINIDEYVESAKHLYGIAKELGTDKVRAFSFFNAYGERNKVIDYLGKLVVAAKSMGVNYYHENEKGIYGDNAERVIDILDNVKDIKCVYDPANFIQVNEPADNTLEKIHHRADYFHIKDVIYKTGEVVPAGYGDGKIDKLIDMITEDKVFTVEPHLKIFGGYAQMDDTELKNKYEFKTNAEAFDKAIECIKKLLVEAGYSEQNKEFVK